MKKLFPPLFFLAIVFVFPFRAEAVTASAWLDGRGRDLIRAVSRQDGAARYAETKKILLSSFHEKEFSRLVLGRIKSSFSAEQIGRYNALFLDFLLSKYIASPIPVKDVDFTIGEQMPSGKDVLVKVILKATAEFKTLQEEGKTVSSDMTFETIFALRADGNDWYIRDVQIEGKSMLITLRKDMERQYDKFYGNPDDLLQYMDTQTQKFKRKLNIVQ